MKKLDTHGNYSVIEYEKELVAIDFSDENVGMSLQTYDDAESALQAFQDTVKTLSEHQAKYHNKEIVKMLTK